MMNHRRISRLAVSAAIALTATAPLRAAELPFVAGKVTKIDVAAGKLTIDHQKIPNLDMPPMTMVFKAADPAMLNGLKAGDRIRFTVDDVNGQMTIEKLEKAK